MGHIGYDVIHVSDFESWLVRLVNLILVLNMPVFSYGLRFGGEYKNMDLIFATPKGTMLDSGNLTKRVFNPILRAAGLRRIRFHDLRHSCASLLISLGESPKYIQKQLRHGSIEMTFDRYGHLFSDTNKETSRRVDAVLFGGRLKSVGTV